jgi:hypothetical protein
MSKPKNVHKTKSIIIKKGDVDVGIIPLVKWLNSFENVITAYSCQGSEDIVPYILFHIRANASSVILEILTVLERRSFPRNIEISIHRDGILGYALYFANADELKAACKDYAEYPEMWHYNIKI